MKGGEITRNGREGGREEHLSQLFFFSSLDSGPLSITEEHSFKDLPRIRWCFMQVSISREGPEPHMPLQKLQGGLLHLKKVLGI